MNETICVLESYVAALDVYGHDRVVDEDRGVRVGHRRVDCLHVCTQTITWKCLSFSRLHYQHHGQWVNPITITTNWVRTSTKIGVCEHIH